MKIDGTNLSMIRGDSESITIALNSVDPITEEPIVFVFGDRVYFTVKLNTSVETKLIQKIITAFDLGKAVVELLPSDTKNLAPKQYKYDIQWVTASGVVRTIVEPALFTILPEVTFEDGTEPLI